MLVERTNRVIAQARSRVNGDQPDGTTRLVSLHEPDARPIRKGRLGKPDEFGYKAQVVDNTDGIIIDHCVPSGARRVREPAGPVTWAFASVGVAATVPGSGVDA